MSDEINIRRVQSGLILQGVMGDVALHRLGFISDRALDITFEREPELDRETVEGLIDDALRNHTTLTHEELFEAGCEFWEGFYSAPSTLDSDKEQS